MALTTTSALLEAAYAQGTGLTCIDAATLEQAEAAVLGAEQAGLPVVLQVSERTARSHLGGPVALGVAMAVLARASLVDVALHLHHVTSSGLLRRATAGSFSSVLVAVEHVDADAPTWESFTARTAEMVRLGHADGLLVAAELGAVDADGQAESPHLSGVRTDPERARVFAGTTGVDALAVAVGGSGRHDARLDLDLVARLAAAVPVPLALADASAATQADVAAAVTAGLTLVGYDTIVSLAFTQAVRQRLHELPGLADPAQYLSPARTATAALVAELVATVGLAAGASRPISGPAGDELMS